METILSGQFHNWLSFIRCYLETQPKHRHLLPNHFTEKNKMKYHKYCLFMIFYNILRCVNGIIVFVCQSLEDSKIRISSHNIRIIFSSPINNICIIYIYVVHCTEFAPETRLVTTSGWWLHHPSSIRIGAPCHISFGIQYTNWSPWPMRGLSGYPHTSGGTYTHIAGQMVGPSFCTIVNRLSRSTPSSPNVCMWFSLI